MNRAFEYPARMARTRAAWSLLPLLVAVQTCTSDESSAPDVEVSRSFGTTIGAAEGPITCLGPESFTTYETTPASVDLLFATTWEAQLAAGTAEVRVYDGAALLATVESVSPIPVTLPYGDHRLTLTLATPGGAPSADPAARCTITLRVTQPCVEDDDCTDAFACSSNACQAAGDGAQCVFGPPPIAGCCVSDFDCASGTYCNPATNLCGACATAAHCDDGDGCTVDACVQGVCQHDRPDPNCCDCDSPVPVADQCVSPSVCVVGSCDCGSGTCTTKPAPVPPGVVCCEDGDHAACADTDPCTVDLCVANQCRNTLGSSSITGCCSEDAECDDGNPCTAEGCDVNLDVCVTTAAPLAGPGCCDADAACDDGEPSTLDACVAFRCVNTPDLGYCTTPATSDLVINELLVDPGAVSDALGEWIELHNRTTDPIDIAGYSLTELGDAPQTVLLGSDGPLVIAPLGYLVLCRNGDVASNGGVVCDATYGNGYALANDDDEVILKDGAGNVVDEVAYDGGPNFPVGLGASIALINPDADNELGGFWRVSLTAATETADKGTPGAKNLDVYTVLESAVCHEKPQDDPCTLDTCTQSRCDHIAVEGCCNDAADCTLTGPCQEAACVSGTCVLSQIPAPECCTTHVDCDDGAACSLDLCIAFTCRHGTSVSAGPGCCDADEDCAAPGNPCVVSGCDEASNLCLPPVVKKGAGCCTTDTYPSAADPAECDDGDPSTIDACKDFLCLSYPDPTYCDGPAEDVSATNNCARDGNPCTGLSCDVANKRCLFDAVPSCCQDASDCFDGDPCTADSCDLKTGACTYKAIEGCCLLSNEAAACDDGNACTTDRCAGLRPLEGSGTDFVGRCRHIEDVPNCCAAAADCDDGNACTVDTCNTVTAACSYSPGPAGCCDPSAGPISTQCNDGEACTNDKCVDNQCVFEPVPDFNGSACCSATGPSCDDGNPCTQDACSFGWCRHIQSADTDCCVTDLDCNDQSVCTTDACVVVSGKKVCQYEKFQCDDGIYCNGIESCDPGLGCKVLAPVVLDDGIPCTVDACSEASKAVTHTPQDALCSDGKYCDGVERCDPVVGCTEGPAPTGDDGIACTQAACDESKDAVIHVPVDALCDDGKACSGTETCDAALGCQKGTSVPGLDDGIACTVDVCNDSTGAISHIPDPSLCDDQLICTTATCSTTVGCLQAISPGFCLIEGACYGSGTKSPTSACLVCDPVKSKTTWSPTTAGTELCNGLDDDCDNLTDEGASGQPLTQPCVNDCGTVGTETCSSGAFGGCTAPTLKELCGNGLDDDCDGTTDGGTCDNAVAPAVGAEVKFTATRGQVSNLVTDNLDGTYSTGLHDLTNPNESGTTLASAFGANSLSLPFDIGAAGVSQVELIAMRDNLYTDSRELRLAVQARDAFGRAAPSGTAVSVSLSGGPLTQAVTLAAVTDTLGRASFTWTAPDAVFTAGGQILIGATVLGVSAPSAVVSAVPAPAKLVLSSAGGGLDLPKSPRFTNETFTVPVVLNGGTSAINAYDVDIDFNRFMLQVVSVTGGTCSSFAGIPVTNAGTDANTSGILGINAISENVNAACGSGAAVNVATITFRVLAGLTPDDPTVSASITGVVREIRDLNFVKVASEIPMLMADASGVDGTGQVRAWSAAVMGIFARTPDHQLLNWKPITGLSDSTQLEVLAYRRDFTTSNVAATVGTSYGVDVPNVVTISTTGSVAPSTQPGRATIAATHKGFVSTTSVSVLHPSPLVVELFDPTLQPITKAVTSANIQLLQTTRFRAKTEWRDDAGVVFEQDVTDRFTQAGQVSVPSTVAYDPTDRRFSSTIPGSYVVSLRTPQGTTVGTSTLVVQDSTFATCNALEVVAPCLVEMVGLDPKKPTVLQGSAVETARVSAVMRAYGQKCQVQVFARFADGTRMKVTGNTGVSVTSKAPGIATSTAGGLLTAVSPGLAAIEANWTLNQGLICTGTTPVLVELPTPEKIIVTPLETTLAISAADPAATIKKLPTGQQLNVKVQYSDGSTQDFTSSATYDAISQDPGDLVLATSAGYVTSTSSGAGSTKVRVSVSIYPTLTPVDMNVDIVKASGLFPEFYETFSPTLPRVTDRIYSYIEGTTTRQDALFEVLMTFTDGTTVDVTQEAGLSIAPLNPATGQPQAGIVSFDKATRRVAASSQGTVDVLFSLGSLVQKATGVTVDNVKEGIAGLVADDPPTTFSGIKDLGTTTIKVWGVMNDGTRRRFSDSRFVPGLLTFASSNSLAATIGATGLATIRGNAMTTFSIDIAAGVDAGAQFNPPLSLATPCNLLPACGDVDLGDVAGLAFKDRAAGEIFTLEARVNTCTKALGSFDVTLTYDELVLEVLDVDPTGATLGAVFSPNWLGDPGTILANGILTPDINDQEIGDGLPVLIITFKAKKGGDKISEMGGLMEGIYDSNGSPIGLPAPRPVVAAAGDLDPPCAFPSEPWDFDDNCLLDQTDLRMAQERIGRGVSLEEALRLSRRITRR